MRTIQEILKAENIDPKSIDPAVMKVLERACLVCKIEAFEKGYDKGLENGLYKQHNY